MNLYIQSCHGTLEYDHARMFTDMGHKVNGEFDVGGQQRPKVEGVTDHNEPLENPDVVILHQVPNYALRFKQMAQAHKVVLTAFGQSAQWQYQAMADCCRRYPNAFIAAYSQREFDGLKNEGCPDGKLRLIRFGKYFEDYPQWLGDWPVVLSACNSHQKRGTGCGWQLVEQLRKQVPTVCAGKETDEVGGVGEMSWQGLKNLYSHAQVFFSCGTMPASIVLTQIDAFCSGIPTVLLDNRWGIADEPLPPHIFIVNDIGEAVAQCKRLLLDAPLRETAHNDSLTASHLFNVDTIKEQWQELLTAVNQ